MTEDYSPFLPLSPATLHILLSLADEDRHGYGIMQEVARQSQGQYKLGPGTLYDNLQKLMTQGLVEESPRPPAHEDPRRRYSGSPPSAAACSRRKSPAWTPWSAKPRFTCAFPGGPPDPHLLSRSAVAASAPFPPAICRRNAVDLRPGSRIARRFCTLIPRRAGSLARQWLLRSGWWKIAAALSLALLEIVFGGFGTMLFGPAPRRAGAATVPPSPSSLNQGAIAHLPLTIGMVMYLAVFVTGGLVVLVIGLTFWMKNRFRTAPPRRP